MYSNLKMKKIPMKRSAPNSLALSNDKREVYLASLMGDTRTLTSFNLRSVLDHIGEREATEIQNENTATCTGWYTVELSNCAGDSNDEIFIALKYVALPLILKVYDLKRCSNNGYKCQFFVDNVLLGNRLKRLGNELAMLGTCKRLNVSIDMGLPKEIMAPEFTSELVNAIRRTLHARYNYESHKLNLSRFHDAPELVEDFCVLHSSVILQKVLQMLPKELPEIKVLDLSDNYISTLRAFAKVAKNLPPLQLINLRANRICNLEELDYLRDLRMSSIVLAGNAVAKNSMSAIYRQLPQLKTINGRTVAGFDLTFKQVYCPAPGCVNFISDFINSYFKCFDAPGGRSQLASFYMNEAIFSLSVPNQLTKVYSYNLYNRNHRRVKAAHVRFNKLQFGIEKVLHAFKRLPDTQHMPSDMNLDLMAYDDHFRNFTITSTFMERQDTQWRKRRYQRTFFIRKNSLGWRISNDILSISHIGQMPQTLDSPKNKPILFTENMEPDSLSDQLIIDTDSEKEESYSVANLSSSMPKLVLSPAAAQGADQGNKNFEKSRNEMDLIQEIDDTPLDDECLDIATEDFFDF